ncbi:MAG: signal peptidase II [candidate division SR1 bacterium]|nr:signal peptidase II [candidate division SR1 bacterium]
MKHLKLRIGVIILTGLDLLSKYVFYNVKYLNETTVILPALNKGISRSLPVPFFIIIGISILGIVAFIRLFAKRKINRSIASLLIAGTIGNLIDRIIYGGVRDFININIFNFPIFNLADTMLCIGVGIRILVLMLEKKK